MYLPTQGAQRLLPPGKGEWSIVMRSNTTPLSGPVLVFLLGYLISPVLVGTHAMAGSTRPVAPRFLLWPSRSDGNLNSSEEMRYINLEYSKNAGRALAQHPLLEKATKIMLCNSSVTDRDLRALRRAHRMKKLALNYTFITGHGLQHLKDCRELELLSLNNCAKIGDDGAAYIARLPNLKFLFLAGTGITDKGLRQIGKLKTLRFLDLSNTKVTGTGFAGRGMFRSLTGLFVCGSKVGDLGLKEIAVLPSLSYLDCSDTPVTGKGVAALTRSKTLRHVVLTGTDLDDSDIHIIAELGKNLQSIILVRTRITPEGARMLRKRCPGLEVLYDPRLRLRP